MCVCVVGQGERGLERKWASRQEGSGLGLEGQRKGKEDRGVKGEIELVNIVQSN